MKYTSEQSQALNIDSFASVQANAGSGKTIILVNKYFRIITEKNIKPFQILAITFTKKAASEMKAKIIRKVEKEINQSSGKDSSKLQIIRKELIKSNISTIHSFCSQILKDFPIESGVAPNFKELNELEIKELKEEATDQILSNYLNKLKAGNLDIDLTEQFTINQINEIIQTIISRPDILLNLNEIYADDFNLNDKIIKNLKITFQENLDASLLILKYAYEQLKTFAPDNKREILNIYSGILSEFDNEKSISEQMNIYKKFNSERILTAEGQLSGQKFRNTKTHNYDYIKNILSDNIKHFKVLLSLEESVENIELIDSHIAYAEKIYQLSKETYELYNDLKSESNGITFDDMIIKASNAIKYDNLSNYLRNKYKFVMVDEFQDTNKIQYDLIREITGIMDENINPEDKSNLFIVGDAKQSIYRFRNADVRVFNEAVADINKVNGNNEGQIKMTYTFRVDPVIADFVNKICNNIFTEDIILNKELSDEFNINYENLKFGKDNRRFGNYLDSKDNSIDNRFGRIDFLISIQDEDKNKYLEAENIANYISNIVDNNGYQVFDEETENFRKIKFSDIAILSRKASGFPNLQKVFIDKNIPYYINSGKGFFNTDEIMEFTSFIRFIQNKSDDIALATILKSPFFSFNDADLFKISQIDSKSSFWKKFIKYSDNNDEYKITRAKQILSEIIKSSFKLNPSSIIDLIIEKTGWYGVVKRQSGSEQKIANVKKLRSYAFNYENKGFKSLYDFTYELSSLSSESGEEEAAVNSGQNAVNIMSVHMSKGLEFPVVILFDTNSKQGGNNSVINPDMDYGIGFKYQKFDDGAYYKEDTPLSFYIKKRIQQAENEEEKRILYVAMTRAQNYLCISTDVQPNKKGICSTQSFAELIYKGLGFGQKIPIDELENLNIKLEFDLDSHKNLNFNNKYYYVSKQNFNFRHIKKETESKKEKNIKLLNPIERSHENEIFSATKIITYFNQQKNNDISYILKYNLGLRDEIENISPENDNLVIDENEIYGSNAGTIIHNVMEKMNDWYLDNNINESKLDNTIKILIKRNFLKDKPLLFQRIKSDIIAVMSKYFILSKIQNIQKSDFEYKLNLALGNDFITGMIDLLYKNEDGKYEIWDWKSNYIPKENSIQKLQDLKDKYEFQMKLYAYLIMRKKVNQNTYNAKLLLTMAAANADNDSEWIIEYNWNKEILEQFGEKLKRIISEIKENNLYYKYLK